MGLDMYAYTTRAALLMPTDFEEPDDARELHTWRKHPDLHGWMEALYFAKGGRADSFNCVGVTLTAADLDRLEADIRARRLPDTTGFFFGNSNGTETKNDLAFIARARAAIAQGFSVYYSSWW
jgi:hypothetical protein